MLDQIRTGRPQTHRPFLCQRTRPHHHHVVHGPATPTGVDPAPAVLVRYHRQMLHTDAMHPSDHGMTGLVETRPRPIVIRFRRQGSPAFRSTRSVDVWHDQIIA